MTETAPDPAFLALLRRLERRGLPPLTAYKEKCLRRRLAVRMRACGVASLEEYVGVVDRRPEEAARLLDALTINVTQFFRNPESWTRLSSLLAELAAEGNGHLKAWSAGCATGEEAWTVAMLLAHTLAPLGRPLAAGRLRVDATDVDPRCAEATTRGLYPDHAFDTAPMELIERWTVLEKGGRGPVPALRQAMTVNVLDLTRERPPDPPYDLIVCRNVLIYFGRETQEAILTRFAAALRPRGVMLLGKVETVMGPGRERFEIIDGRERLYRRRA